MNFEGFQNLLIRVVKEWYNEARTEHKDFTNISNYLKESPFTAKQTPQNEEAYEKLMDVRMKLYELSYEIDANHDAYMEFMQQTLDSPNLMDKVVRDLTTQEKHLVHLELMIMEQVADWELDTGKVDSGTQWDKVKQLVVHLPNGSTRTLSISQECDHRYWFGICAESSKIGDVKMCAGCKVVGYIGKDEQKDDWSSHKALCKALKKARGASDHWSVNMSANEMRFFLEKELNRSLNQFENDVIDHPKVCMVCLLGDSQSKLKVCKNCFCVAFCPQHVDEGKKIHMEHCTPLRYAAEDYKNEKTLGHQVQNYTPTILKKHQPLEGNIETFFSSDISNLVSRKLPGYQESELRYLTFMYSCPLTVLYGLESALPANEMTRLTIHLVGVRRAEIRHLTGWEILACRLPSLKQLTLVFIGDECLVGDFPKEFTYKGKELQAERKSVEISYIFEPPMLYQDYAKSKGGFKKPDLVVALDCGFKFYPSWQPALKVWAEQIQCPLIFTEFTLQDQRDNLKIVQDLAPTLEVIINPKRNPFCSRRPVRCSDKSGNYLPFSVIYTNDYICLVKCK